MTTGKIVREFDEALLQELKNQLSSIASDLENLCKIYQGLEKPTEGDEWYLNQAFNEFIDSLKVFHQKHVHFLDSKNDYFEQGLSEVFDRQLLTFLDLGDKTARLDLKVLYNLAAYYSNAGSNIRKYIEMAAFHLIKIEKLDLEGLSLWSNAIYSSDGLQADYVAEHVRYEAEQCFQKLLLASE